MVGVNRANSLVVLFVEQEFIEDEILNSALADLIAAQDPHCKMNFSSNNIQLVLLQLPSANSNELIENIKHFNLQDCGLTLFNFIIEKNSLQRDLNFLLNFSLLEGLAGTNLSFYLRSVLNQLQECLEVQLLNLSEENYLGVFKSLLNQWSPYTKI